MSWGCSSSIRVWSIKRPNLQGVSCRLILVRGMIFPTLSLTPERCLGLREQSNVGCFPEFVLQFSVVQVFANARHWWPELWLAPLQVARATFSVAPGLAPLLFKIDRPLVFWPLSSAALITRFISGQNNFLKHNCKTRSGEAIIIVWDWYQTWATTDATLLDIPQLFIIIC